MSLEVCAALPALSAPEAAPVYAAPDMPFAVLAGQISAAYQR
ncbi:hypothetical protein P3T27_003040 [Kitasatospora sp. MAA19]|nr:hypothetical protein [Kitasatospora sp. MAA19]MDH6706317.1 hypothetical protein [Kitasatospora sp. MAA19]